MTKKAKKATKVKREPVDLGPVVELRYSDVMQESRAVDEEEALALIASGWVLTQNTDQLIVVALPASSEKE